MPSRRYDGLSRAFLFIVLTALVAYNLLAWVPESLARKPTAISQLELLADLRHEIVDQYVEEPNTEKMTERAVQGMVSALEDPFTQYFSPEDLQEFDKRIRGSFSGIGAEIDEHNNRIRIVSPLEDSPAFNAGVLPGDIIMSVDGKDTEGMNVQDAVDVLTGPEGTDVTIRVKHKSGEFETITITRARIEVHSVKGLFRQADNSWDLMIDRENKIGYLKLTSFSGTTVEDMRNALNTLKQEGAKGVILDMRFNPGGLLDAAIAVSDMFLPEGKTIVSVKGRVVPEESQKSTTAGTLTDLPLVVLANEASASASEIVTGALADNGRAKFVGTRTFGKGSVQQIRMLDSGQGAIKITNAYYYLPSGRNIHRKPDAEVWGVDPEDGFYVGMTPKQIETMFETWRETDLLRVPEGQKTPSVDAKWLREKLGDLQLAAGYEALLGKINTGDWPVVGESDVQDIVTHIRKREALVRQKELITERLGEIEKELAALEAGEDVDVSEEALNKSMSEGQPEDAPEGAVDLDNAGE